MTQPEIARSADDIAAVFAALGQVTRIEAFRLLVRYHPFGLAAGDIARLLAVPHNTLSSHLAILQAAKLLRSHKSGRTVVYAAAPESLDVARQYLEEGKTRSRLRRPKLAPEYPTPKSETVMAGKSYNVLILCTGNSARSILAEAIINREGKGQFRAYSAGSQPKGRPNPIGLQLLTDLGYDITGLRSKSWNEFAEADAPRMDFVITVCDNAAGETCPYWPGHPLVAHWGIPDPAEVGGTVDQKRAAFHEAYRRLMNRVTALVNLPVDALSLNDLKAALTEIGRMEGATELAQSTNAA